MAGQIPVTGGPIPKAPGPIGAAGARPMTVGEIASAVTREAEAIGLDASVYVYRGNFTLAEVQCSFRNLAGRGGAFMYMFPIDAEWFEADGAKLRRFVRGELAKVCLVHGLAPVEIGIAGEKRVRGRSFSEITREMRLADGPPTTPRIPVAPAVAPLAVPPRSYYYDTPKK